MSIVIELAQDPQIISLPSAIRLYRVNGLRHPGGRSSYFRLAQSLIGGDVFTDRKIDRPDPCWNASLTFNAKSVSEMVEGTSERVEHFASDRGDVIRDGVDARHVVEYISRIRICLEGDSAWCGLVERIDSELEMTDVFVGPFDF